ncbi:MAG TPA: copper-binding protein [Sideroxyarcus sp.]|nr:copper-binding protein [Sideroxyarcus sp.]
MKSSKLLLILAIALGSGTAYAEPTIHQHEAHAPAKHEGYGVLKEVNAAAGKVKIAHEPIPALEWPSMTMWFSLQGALPEGIKAGDRVRFELQQENGKWLITRIESGK